MKEKLSGELAQFVNFGEKLASAAGTITLPYFRTPVSVDNKSSSRFDPVTVADKFAERTMREMILAQYPDHGIMGEEEGYRPGRSPHMWVLDPIDGTQSFISGLPLWGTLIALSEHNRCLFGLMDQPFMKERFLGTGDMAWFNGSRIYTRPCSRLDSATLICASPSPFQYGSAEAILEKLFNRVQSVRYGGDCYAYCMLASGYIDIVIDFGLEPYDVQALIPIIQGAGGIVTTWNGSEAHQGGNIVACGDPALHAKVLGLLKNWEI